MAPPQHIVLAKAWIRKGDAFLIVRRADGELQAPGAWFIPGGKVELGGGRNVIEETLRREVEEEVGLRIGEDFVLIDNNAFVRVDGAPVVGLTFLVSYAGGNAQALEETSEVRWLSLDELLEWRGFEDYMQREVAALAGHFRRQIQ